jgi:hypothetical protein
MFILGAECMVIEKAVLANAEGANAGAPAAATGAAGGSSPVLPAGTTVKKRTITPPEWAPWSLMSAGAVVSLYSFTIPARRNAG